ncbi:hypothetical protein DCAR_0729037 [Daucus carota subsp. sativus]|uniref:ARID domain-containing protein n=1 Tax=Daucus carota subsp. sativus TaxID=79200 RepID=A0AAF0XMN2_DAUCS|nr:hypothetical protein DCAR_0729037 [Daucus carota subsp. sativus]
MQENQEEYKGAVQAKTQMDGCDESVAVRKMMNMKLSSSDDFYEKLTRFHHSSGLTLIFDFRKTKVDLYRFYKDVTKRGGYHEVTKGGKWDEVASSLNAEGGVIISPNQTQMLYANFFHQFEQTYYYRTNFEVKPFKTALTGLSSVTDKSSGSPAKKAKKQRLNEHNADDLVEKRVSAPSSFQFPTVVKSMEKNRSLQVPLEEASLLLQTPAKAKETQKSSDREMKQHKNAPMGVRTSYMIFHRMECERLKIIHGKGSPGQIRNMANDAWKRLSEHDRQPYIEASKRDKERYSREMAEFKIAYKQIAATQSVSANTESTTAVHFPKPPPQTDSQHHPNLSDDAYHVNFPHDASDNVVIIDEKFDVDIVQKAESNDPTIQLNMHG